MKYTSLDQIIIRSCELLVFSIRFGKNKDRVYSPESHRHRSDGKVGLLVVILKVKEFYDPNEEKRVTERVGTRPVKR